MIMQKSHFDICKEVSLIVSRISQIPMSEISEESWNLPLTASFFHMNGQALVYLYFEVAKHYAVQIPGKFLDHNGFNSIGKIASIVEAIENRKQ